MHRAALATLLLSFAAQAATPAETARQHRDRADKLFEEGDWARAVVEYEASLAAKHDSQLLYQLGRAYQMLGDFKKAVQAYSRYLSEVPNAAVAAEAGRQVEDLTPYTVRDAPQPPQDRQPPHIRHAPPSIWPAGEAITLEATIEDRSGIFEPKLYYRFGGSGAVAFIPTRLKLVEGSKYSGLIAPMETGELHYFLEAYDSEGNGPARFGTPTYPHVLQIVEAKNAVALARTPPPSSPDVEVAVEPAAVAPVELAGASRPPRGPWAYVTLGVGALAAVGGTYFGMTALSSARERDTVTSVSASQAADDRATGSATMATVSWIASSVLVGGGLSLWLFTDF